MPKSARVPPDFRQAHPALPGQERGRADEALGVLALGPFRLAGVAAEKVIDLRNARRVGKARPRALDRSQPEKRKKIIRDVRSDLPVIEDGKPSLADALHDLVEAAGNHERLDRLAGDLRADPQIAPRRADDDRVERLAVEPLQDAPQVP